MATIDYPPVTTWTLLTGNWSSIAAASPGSASYITRFTTITATVTSFAY